MIFRGRTTSPDFAFALSRLLSSIAIHQLLGNKLNARPNSVPSLRSHHESHALDRRCFSEAKPTLAAWGALGVSARSTSAEAFALDHQRGGMKRYRCAVLHSAQCCEAHLCAVRQALPTATHYLQSATRARARVAGKAHQLPRLSDATRLDTRRPTSPRHKPRQNDTICRPLPRAK